MGEPDMTHDFRERLHYSEIAGDEPFWIEVYKQAFPGMVSQVPCPGDTKSQRDGIDRVIVRFPHTRGDVPVRHF